MRRQGARVAPVPVEAPLAAGCRSAADLEQERGGLQHLADHHLLRLIGVDVGLGVLLGRGLTVQVGLPQRIQVTRDFLHHRLAGEGQARQAPDHPLHQRILARAGLAGNAEGARTPLDEGDGIALHGTGDAGQGGQVHLLVEGADVGVAPALTQFETAENLLLADFDPLEAGGAAGGQALAEPVPVIQAGDAGRRGRHGNGHMFVALVGRDGNPVGIEGTGAVVLLAVEQPAPAVLAQVDAVAGGFGAFGHRRAEQLASDHALEPARVALLVLIVEAPFDEAEMRTKDLRQVGVGLGQAADQAEQLLQAGTEAAMTLRHAQAAEAGIAQPAHGVIRQLATLLAGDGAVCDTVEEGLENGQQVRIAGRCSLLVERRVGRIGFAEDHLGVLADNGKLQ